MLCVVSAVAIPSMVLVLPQSEDKVGDGEVYDYTKPPSLAVMKVRVCDWCVPAVLCWLQWVELLFKDFPSPWKHLRSNGIQTRAIPSSWQSVPEQDTWW